MQPQGELFPYAKPETVLAYCRRLEAMVLTIAPEMTKAHCLRMLEELVLSTSVMDQISVSIRLSREWQARHQLAQIPDRQAPDRETVDERLEEARHWDRAHPPITYPHTQTPAWPDRGHWRRHRR